MTVKISVSIVICLIVSQSVYGLFWDFSRPTNNAGQAAAGGAFLGAAGILTLCWVKDNCRGKREIDAANNEIWSIDGNTLEYISAIDPSDCIRRLVCDVSTGNKDFVVLENILKILPKEGARVPSHLKKLSNQLRTAQKYGQLYKDVNACEAAFKCPLSGEEFKDIMEHDENKDYDNTL